MQRLGLAGLIASAALVLSAPQAGAAPAQACLKSLRALAGDDIPRASDFTPAACGDKQAPAAFYYDRASGATRASRPIAAGDVVMRFAEFGHYVIVPGQHLKLVVEIGAVRVERDVEALQEAGPGEWLFVRDAKQNVFSVKYGAVTP